MGNQGESVKRQWRHGQQIDTRTERQARVQLRPAYVIPLIRLLCLASLPAWMLPHAPLGVAQDCRAVGVPGAVGVVCDHLGPGRVDRVLGAVAVARELVHLRSRAQ